MPKITLYRGHKQEDYLSVEAEPAVCFSTDKEKARLYGQGKNNDGDPKYANGSLTTAEFAGKIKKLDINGIDFKKHYSQNPAKYSQCDAVECRGGIVYVFAITKLRKISTEKA